MKRLVLLTLIASFSFALAACNAGGAPEPLAKPDSTAVATAASNTAPVRPLIAGQNKGSCGGATEACGAARAEPGSCAEAANVPDSPVITATDPVSGAPMSIVGTKLASLPVVTVADLLAKPADYAGKTVRVEGDVSAMCTHRRGWFSVQDAGNKDGTYVRILTAPSFLVPPGSIGKKARAEGRVELIDVNPEAARHYAEEHKLNEPNANAQPSKTVVIRASGAEFI